MTDGTARSGSARASEDAITAPHSPRLALLSVTTRSIESMWATVRSFTMPSESEIAVAISTTVRNPEACVAISAATQVRSPTWSDTGASAWMTRIAMHACTASWEMLNTNFTGGSRRSNSITSAMPSRQPITNASALQKIRPKTSGMSPSENECAPRRKWRWTTQRSAIANAIAIDHHGRCGCASGWRP